MQAFHFNHSAYTNCAFTHDFQAVMPLGWRFAAHTAAVVLDRKAVLPIAAGETFDFTIEGIGSVRATGA